MLHNGDHLEHCQETVACLGYIPSADSWNRTLRNWQSELLAVGSVATLPICLRQRGTSEAKPVGTPHDEAPTEGE